MLEKCKSLLNGQQFSRQNCDIWDNLLNVGTYNQVVYGVIMSMQLENILN